MAGQLSLLPLDRDESLHGDCERGKHWGREGHLGQAQQHGQQGRQNLGSVFRKLDNIAIKVLEFDLCLLHLKSVELAVERDGEHENAEDDADGVEDAQLRDQPPERDLQT